MRAVETGESIYLFNISQLDGVCMALGNGHCATSPASWLGHPRKRADLPWSCRLKSRCNEATGKGELGYLRGGRRSLSSTGILLLSRGIPQPSPCMKGKHHTDLFRHQRISS
jgi:hypothetical protein